MLDSIEITRMRVQRHLDAQKTQLERNRLGQFATPLSLADEIMSVALSYLPLQTQIRFLDPACGTGAFFSALYRCATNEHHITAATGYEIDYGFGSAARRIWGDLVDVEIKDFTATPSPADEEGRFNLLVSNPPYVRHHHLSKNRKVILRDQIKSQTGISLSGLSGLYCYFIGLADRWMAKNGIAAWLIPSESLDVNYGKQLKSYFLNHVTLLRIHRFDSYDLQFEDALVSSSVVFFRKSAPAITQRVDLTSGASLLSPSDKDSIPVSTLRSTPKWSYLEKESASAVLFSRQLRLGDLFRVQRGVASGDNKFFIVEEKQALHLSLPTQFLVPILPSPRYVTQSIIEADQLGKPVLDKRLFLVSCDLPLDQLEVEFPTLWLYYKSGEAQGVQQGYLCQHRSPWYAQEKRRPALFLCSYMGRMQSAESTPLRFILNRSQAVAPNVYLNLYPNPKLQSALATSEELVQKIWAILNALPNSTLLSQGRQYGGGLHKIEPKELANVPLADSIGLGQYCT